MNVTELESHYSAVKRRLWGPSPKPVATAVKRRTLPALGPKPGVTLQAKPIAQPEGVARIVYAYGIGPTRPSPYEIAKRIKAEVSRAHKVTVMDLESERRDVATVRARHCAMWHVKRETPWSLSSIGRAFGGRDHSSVIHGVRRHQARIDAGEVMP